MIGVFNTIEIDGTTFYRPSDMELKKTDVYSGEYTSLTGALIADRIGWKYADTTLKWDTLPNDMLLKLSALSGAVSFIFNDSDGSHTEQIIRGAFSNTATRFTNYDGSILWRNVAVDIRFLNTHDDGESE